MRTQGEIEAAVCQGVASFKLQHMGRGPKDVQTFLLGDLLVIRLQGVLTAAEQHLINTHAPEKGRNLIKEVRSELIEGSRSIMESMIYEATGVKVVSLHYDISTSSGEEVIVFTLVEPPQFREKNGR